MIIIIIFLAIYTFQFIFAVLDLLYGFTESWREFLRDVDPFRPYILFFNKIKQISKLPFDKP